MAPVGRASQSVAKSDSPRFTAWYGWGQICSGLVGVAPCRPGALRRDLNRPDTHVDVRIKTSRDAGSTPAASMPRLCRGSQDAARPRPAGAFSCADGSGCESQHCFAGTCCAALLLRSRLMGYMARAMPSAAQAPSGSRETAGAGTGATKKAKAPGTVQAPGGRRT